MKRILLLILATLPLYAFTINFIFCNDENYDEYWYDENWHDEYWCDGDWIYYPHGYYCVHYVWWYPWWWDWYWWHCQWCHTFYWDFFYSGFYVVWYEDGCWWFRPRYGQWVRYELPYPYYTIRYNAASNGIYLPEKPPREIDISYNETQVMKLSKQKDPQLFARVEQEHKSGNLEKMRQVYVKNVKEEISKKNQEYGLQEKRTSTNKSIVDNKNAKDYTIKRADEKDSKTMIDIKTKENKTKGNSKSSITIKEKPRSDEKSNPSTKTPEEYKQEQNQPATKKPSTYYQQKDKPISHGRNQENNKSYSTKNTR